MHLKCSLADCYLLEKDNHVCCPRHRRHHSQRCASGIPSVPALFVDAADQHLPQALAAAALDRTYWNEVLDMSRIIVRPCYSQKPTPTNLSQAFIGCPHRSANSLDMEDRLSRFLFANYDSGVADAHPLSSIAGLAAAVIEINGLFVESKVPVRSRVISIHTRALQGHRINQVRRLIGRRKLL